MDYPQAFREVAHTTLSEALLSAIIRRARAKAGGHAKAVVSQKLLAQARSNVAQAVATHALQKSANVHKAGARLSVDNAPIVDQDRRKQIVYCVVLEPGVYDQHNDIVDAEIIEDASHAFMTHSRIIKSEHLSGTTAVPVESYIAPQDLHFDTGMYGAQSVKKGSWVLGIKINDAAEWQKVVSGQYTGFSVGGIGTWSDV